MSNLANWLRSEMDSRALSQTQLSARASVSQSIISEVLNKDHIPRVETLFHLADALAVSRERVLRPAGHLPDGAEEPPRDRYVEALLSEFRQVPEEWKPIVVEQVAQYRRLAEHCPQIIVAAGQ